MTDERQPTSEPVRDPVCQVRYAFEREGQDLIVHCWLEDCHRPPWLDTPRLLDFSGAGGGEARRRYGDLVALR